MYCIKCGVELADSEKVCPLCGTTVYHPELKQTDVKLTFPKTEPVREEFNRNGILFIFTFLFIIPFLLTLVCDLSLNQSITWSVYTMSSIALAYIIIVLPLWFRSPNPTVFVPIDFAAVGLLLFVINYHVDGRWFYTLALPAVCMAALLVSGIITLMRYLKKGYLYIFGGASMLSGFYMMLTEFLINYTFGFEIKFIWSPYPLTVFFLLGTMLIVIALCPPLYESLHKKFFI